MAVELYLDDLLPFAPAITQEQADILIAGVTARAAVFAACILDPAFPSTEAAKDILRVAVLRQFQAVGGVVTQQTVGQVQVTFDRDTASRLFTDAEMAELQQMCRDFAGVVTSSAPLAVYSFPDCPPRWPDPAPPPWLRP